MPFTAAEKQKRYRERMRENNPQKFEEAKIKNAARNKKRKKIYECTENEKEILRRQWRQRKNAQKNNKNEGSRKTQSDSHTDDAEIDTSKSIIKIKLAERKKFMRHLAIIKSDYQSKITVMTKELKKLKKKCYRVLKKQNELIECIEELKVKNLELQANQDPTNTMLDENESTIQDENEMTPLTKTDNFINTTIPNISTPEKQKVKKTILSYNVLTKAIQNTYENLTNNKERNILKSVVESEITKKYKAKHATTTVLGLKGRARRRKDILRKNRTIVTEIKQFYERDDVTRATAGRNEVKTVKKNKQQRRYLLKSLKDLYKKYRAEGGKAKYSSFKQHRPFYVLPPKLSNRETCGCIKHENIMRKTDKLKNLGMIHTKDIDEILMKVQCDLNSKECAYGNCITCKNKSIDFNWDTHNRSEIVIYEEFKLENHEYVNKKDNRKTTTKKMAKKEISGTIESLTEKFNKDLDIIRKHIYNIKHQYIQYTSCIKNLRNNEVAIHIDFSENYMCKLSTEVQSMHFGGSKPQITLHTGVLYTNENKEAFASVSPINEHGPEAIWAHLEPILNHVRTEFPAVTAVHFFSDGPCTQYRQKKNFFLFAKYTKALGFPHSTWNFSEASHGKGAADGVGGAIKRRLDNCVAQGTDIPNAEIAYNILKDSDSSIMTFYISETDLAKYSILDVLLPVPQTMALHQIANMTLPNAIKYRCLSCFCTNLLSPRGYCECLDVKHHFLVQTENPEKEVEIINSSNQNNKGKQIITRKRRISELSGKTDSEQEEKENTNKTNKTQKISRNKKKAKVTILADVRYHSDNLAFYGNLQNSLLKAKIIDKSFDLLNMSTDHPIPSTSGLCESRKNTTNTKKNSGQTQSRIDSDASSTENDEDYSVHDSSEDGVFISTDDENYFQIDMKEESSCDRTFKRVKEISKNYSEVQLEKTEIANSKIGEIINTELPNTEEENDCVLPNTAEGNCQFPGTKEGKVCELSNIEKGKDYVLSNAEEEKDCQIPNTEERKLFNVGDSVIVRYFQRQSWKYYIGFIESVQVDDEVRYSIRFLKTIHKPTLKFVLTKKDRDIVPDICVVKKVELDFIDKAYLLKKHLTSDQIFFFS